jgi:hypothetical protein
MAVRLSALRTSRTLLPRNIIIFLLLVLIWVRGLLSLVSTIEELLERKSSGSGLEKPRIRQ